MTTQHNFFKLTILLIVFLFQFQKSFAIGEACNTAYSAAPSANYTQNNYLVNNVDKSVWISFVANESAIQIYTYELAANPGTVVNEMYVYSGACGSTSLISSKVFDYTNYGVRTLYLDGLIVGNSYLVKCIAAIGNSNISISLSTINSIPPSAACIPSSPTPIKWQNPNLPNSFTMVMPANILPGSIIIVDENVMVQVNSSRTLNNCTILMGKASSIVATANLTITNRTNIFGCTDMWKGIESLQQHVYLDGDSYIGDAEIGLKNASEDYVHDAIFNRCTKAIQYENNAVVFSGQVPLRNIIITSRSFGYSSLGIASPTTTTLKSINPATQKTFLEGYAATGLLNSPIVRPFCGVADYHSGTYPLLIGQFPLGVKDNNIFDNLDYGILCGHSNANCINNVFQYMSKGSTSSNLWPFYFTGVGIVADAGVNTSNASTPFIINVGVNTSNYAQNTNSFYNCFQGIVSNYSNSIIKYNTFDCDGLNNLSNQLAFFAYPGSGGNLIFENNKVIRYPLGTRLLSGSTNFTYTNLSFSNNNFNLGTIGNNGGGIGMNFGSLGNSSTTVTAKINNNTMTNVIVGINLALNGGIIGKSEISGNTISMISNGSFLGNSSNAGINLNKAERCNITENTITSNYTSGAVTNFTTGVNLSDSKNCHLQCNHVSNVRQGFVFDGSCTAGKSYVFTYNSMANCRDGLVLTNSIGGIGKNGSATSPAENTWTGFFDRSQTLSDNATFDFTLGGIPGSYFYCRLGISTTPTLNIDIMNLQFNILHPDLASGPNIAVCNAIQPSIANNDPIDVFKELIIDESEYPVLGAESEWQNKKYAYEKLTFDPEFATINDPELNDFIDDIQNENIATVAWTEEMIRQYDYYYAKYLNNGLTPQNLMEQNHQTFTKYYILWCENPNREFTSIELNDLYTIANQCVNLGGKAVLQAQVFYDYISREPSTWNTNCPVPASALRKASKAVAELRNSDIEMPNNFYFTTNCNPCKDDLQFKISNSETLSSLTFTDILGKKITDLIPTYGISNFNISSFTNGVYFLNLRLSSGKFISKKIIIANN